MLPNSLKSEDRPQVMGDMTSTRSSSYLVIQAEVSPVLYNLHSPETRMLACHILESVHSCSVSGFQLVFGS